ncbi:MAG: LBP/BPI/CETP family protein [Myxococcales bacterium]
MIRSILRPAPQILLAIALASCSGQTSSCGCLGTITPLAQPLDNAHVTQSGAQAYVTPGGFTFLDQSVSTLIGSFLPGGLTFWVPETSGSGGCLFGACAYDYYICRAQDCPYSNDAADCNENGVASGGACPIAAKIDSLAITTATPSTLDAVLHMDVDYNEYGLNGSGACVQGGSGQKCRNDIWINGDVLFGAFNVACDTPGITLSIDNKEVDIGIELTIDPISEALGVAITSVTGANGGALFSSSDFSASCGIEGDIINAASSLVVGLLNSQIQSMLQSQIGKQLDKSLCMPQNYYTGSVCPTSLSGVASVAGKDQNGDPVCCAAGTACASSGGGAGCVAKPLGLIGIADLSSFLAKYGAPDSKLQLEVFPGQDQPPSQEPLIKANGGGLLARVVTGVEALSPSTCVPSRPAPPATPQADIDFDAAAKSVGLSSYMVGAALSGTFLNEAAYEAYNSGLLCLDINSYNESLLSTALLSPVLPSLGYIAPNNAVWAVLRPQNPPTIALGAGLVQDGGIIDPLMNVTLKDLRIDLFASVDERPVRLFSLSTDVEVPLALSVGTGGTAIDVVLGNLNNILVNLNATQSNILAENPTQLLKLIPLVLQLAGPSLAKVPSFNLPSLSGFGFVLDGIHGIVTDPEGGYEDVGIFADLVTTSDGGGGPMPAPLLGPPPDVAIVDSLEPALADVGPGGTLKLWPTAIVSVDQSRWPTESSWSIDDGMWSAWAAGGRLSVTAPSFLLQGHHSILFRTRPLGSRAEGWSLPLDFLADYTPPTLDLEVSAAGRWTLTATDNFTPADQLVWSSSVGGAAFSEWVEGAPDPNGLAAQGPFVVRVRDQAGNVAQAASDPSLLSRSSGDAAQGGSPATTAPARPAAPATGCGTSGGEGAGALLLAVLGLLASRRRRVS